MANEPQWVMGDDIARGIYPRCDRCEERHEDDDCGATTDDPDNLYDSMNERD